MSLAFVPPKDVITEFHTVLDEIPDNLDNKRFSELFSGDLGRGHDHCTAERAMYPPTTYVHVT